MQAITAKLNTHRMFWILSGALFVLFMAYAYFVNAAIMGAVNRQKVQAHISQLSSETANLESQYIALKNSINLTLAYSMGFKNETDTKFIARKSVSGSLTLR
jgi:hypothetical protein